MIKTFLSRFFCLLTFVLANAYEIYAQHATQPVDYVNPYIGNISHLLVPTFPTVHLPNSMLRVYPQREDYTGDQLEGLPLLVTSHRGRSAFGLHPRNWGEQDNLQQISPYSYDNEEIRPYQYRVRLLDEDIQIDFAPSHQSAIYQLRFTRQQEKAIVLTADEGSIQVEGRKVQATQQLDNNTTVYLFAEFDQQPTLSGIIEKGVLLPKEQKAKGSKLACALRFPDTEQTINMRYGVSFISLEQAEKNLKREIRNFQIEQVASKGRDLWNRELSKFRISSSNLKDMEVFYTALYRCYERPVNISEDGRYFSAFDGRVHEDPLPFFTDDWIWDTYRATHPLRILIDESTESHILSSYIRMAEQMEHFWLPTFPEITGDSRRMNSNHGVVTIADAYAKGLRNFDVLKAYEAGKRAVREKTLAPWSGAPAGWLDDFYKEQGYIPALWPGEKEEIDEVNPFEKRQPVAVTLGTSYDEWSLGQLAVALGKGEDAATFLKNALNYRHIFNKSTLFFHPKDKKGNFIEPFDYRFAGGQGAREYYGENNGWVYRWDVPHNIADLIQLMGGKDTFVAELDRTFREPLGRSKFEFYSQLPDHTGNVGQFSMANEPSLHIPYLYAYAGKPWMTQKRVKELINQWFRSDLMGMPGDEDGGGMSAFVVFSMIGFYPVTPGLPVYTIGSPFFEEMSIRLSSGKTLKVIAPHVSKTNKYIQKAWLNDSPINRAWISHEEISKGGVLHFEMGDRPNKEWGTANPPPSFVMPEK
ncbi:GH92 family glycosyl hydrolase [Sphingobacterium faecale]|uniref:GH92 family glycosyl hydrolase n=1 Tax=Sphingobacterium faecale TaxID=2803775 RepID=A0ABS1R6Z0_9SPHI|nr:GH92 family glycosyl hydrolase [Sphingobacterium faecale]MBL1410443.1 GH92 family glycosyl hydrolase [Sphingobacterium faecale]